MSTAVSDGQADAPARRKVPTDPPPHDSRPRPPGSSADRTSSPRPYLAHRSTLRLKRHRWVANRLLERPSIPTMLGPTSEPLQHSMPPQDLSTTDEVVSLDTHQIAINTIRFLAVDMVERARSGIPERRWDRRHGLPAVDPSPASHPANPDWPNRDRFVLSCGHASALIYSLLHLAGYDLRMEELRNFRQLGLEDPGAPRVRPHARGSRRPPARSARGCATPSAWRSPSGCWRRRFNRDGFPLFDHRVWVIASDGDLMEGVASEACSLAGHLGLGKLNVFYDDNRSRSTARPTWPSPRTSASAYEAYGWHVLTVDDGNDLRGARRARGAARPRPVGRR